MLIKFCRTIASFLLFHDLLSPPACDYMVFHKKWTPFSFFHNSLKRQSIYTKFLQVVAEKIHIQNISTKYGS